jgi:hypothetical protein
MRISTLATPTLSRNHHRPKADVFRAYTRQGIDGDHSRDRYQADQALANRIYGILRKHYPGHFWRVETSHKQGVATIRLMGLSDVPHVLKIEDLKLLSAEQDVMRAGGELLERFRMPTSGFTEAHFQSAVRQFKPHLTRRKHPDLIGAR